MPTLPTVHMAAHPFRAGDRVRVLHPREWGGPRMHTSESYQFESLGTDGKRRSAGVVWDGQWRRVGLTGEAAHVATYSGLVFVTFGGPVTDADPYHPAWLAGPGRPPEDGGAACVCPLADLMVRGCTCGAFRLERERAGKAA
jgi:hypothetical protein